MKCEIIRDLLPLYADGLTSEESNRLIEEHIESCSECAAQVKGMCEPMEITPSQEAYDCVEMIYRQKRRTKMKLIAVCVLTAVIVFGGCWYYMKTHPRSVKWSDVEISKEEILEEIPELALTETEKELGKTIMGTPTMQEYLREGAEKYTVIPYEQMKMYLVDVIPEDARVAEIGLLHSGLIVDYYQEDTRTILEYGDGDLTGYVDWIGKYMSIASEDGIPEAVYSLRYDVASGNTEYTKSAPETHWYDFIFPD